MRSSFGFLVPPTRGTSRPAGWLHQSVAPARTPGSETATASVRDGTRETTRIRGYRDRFCTASTCSATATTTTRVSDTVARQRWRTPPVRYSVSPRPRR